MNRCPVLIGRLAELVLEIRKGTIGIDEIEKSLVSLDDEVLQLVQLSEEE